MRGSGSVSLPIFPSRCPRLPLRAVPRFSHVQPLPLPRARGLVGARGAFPASAAPAEGSAPAAMSQADPELLLRELGGWDWELCRRELPAVLPRLIISFPAGRLGGCGKGTGVVVWRGVWGVHPSEFHGSTKSP